MALTDKLTAIADAVRGLTGKTQKFSLDQMASEIASYGVPFKFGGKNAEKVADYDETITLADTSFVVGSSASTSATSIKATISNRFTTPTLAVGDKDIVIVQYTEATPTHSAESVDKGRQIKHAGVYVVQFSKRKTSDTSANTTRQYYATTSYINKFFNASGALARSLSSYGFYMTAQTPTLSSTTSANCTVNVGSPILYYRVNNGYESAANIVLVTDCTFKWHVDVYLVEPASTMGRVVGDEIDKILVYGLDSVVNSADLMSSFSMLDKR